MADLKTTYMGVELKNPLIIGAGPTTHTPEICQKAARVGDWAGVVLKTNMGAGHGGVSGRFAKLDEIAFNYIFLLRVFDRLDPEDEPAEPS